MSPGRPGLLRDDLATIDNNRQSDAGTQPGAAAALNACRGGQFEVIAAYRMGGSLGPSAHDVGLPGIG
jgi:hypothetical protein